MHTVRDLSQRIVGWMAGDILFNTQGDVCAFVRGSEVFTFRQRHVGQYDRGLFRNAGGDPVGTARFTSVTPCHRERRRRFRVTPWLQFSRPAPQTKMTFRAWAIWDREIDRLSA